MATRRPKSHGPNTLPMPLSIHRGKYPELAAWIDTLPLGAGATRVRAILDELMRMGLLLPGGRLGSIGTDAQQQSLIAQNNMLRERMQELEVENAMLKRRLRAMQPELFERSTTAGAPDEARTISQAAPQGEGGRTQAAASQPIGSSEQGRPVDRQTALNWANGLRPGGGRPGSR